LQNQNHCYYADGNYNVILAVTDNYGMKNFNQKIITVYTSPQKRTITGLQTKWNLISIMYTQPINEMEITVHYNGNDFNWPEATTNNNPTGESIILKSIYGLNRTTEAYILSKVLNPRYWCWMYVYHNCSFLRSTI
jgi:hypothetical protein